MLKKVKGVLVAAVVAGAVFGMQARKLCDGYGAAGCGGGQDGVGERHRSLPHAGHRHHDHGFHDPVDCGPRGAVPPGLIGEEAGCGGPPGFFCGLLRRS